MKKTLTLFTFMLLGSLLPGCDNSVPGTSSIHHDHTGSDDIRKGPHGGRLLQSGDFSLELAIFESGVPPEFRAWASYREQALQPDEVALSIRLTRLSNKAGGEVDNINFTPSGDALRGDMVIHEPHSFAVSIAASYNGSDYHWQYDNFEGRTTIAPLVADALQIETSIAGPAVLEQSIEVFGRFSTGPEALSNVRARFAGVIESVSVTIGDTVHKGQILATVESNESLKSYPVKAPISGVISRRSANPGEQTAERTLFTIVDSSLLWLELSVFPQDRHAVHTGAVVSVPATADSPAVTGSISSINVSAEPSQAVIARMAVDNKNAQLLPGSYVKAQIKIAEHAVPLAVKRSALQTFRDFTVVYAQVGDQYEVRMLETGREDRHWVEVLDGLQAGTVYVSQNSYVIKADIEKSGASHDH